MPHMYKIEYIKEVTTFIVRYEMNDTNFNRQRPKWRAPDLDMPFSEAPYGFPVTHRAEEIDRG